MSNDNPEDIRRDIERTRAELSDNVNALADTANPAQAARRQVDKLKEGAHDLKTRVFGDPDDPSDDGAVGGVVGDVQAKASGLADDAAQQVQRTPAKLRRSTQGNPLAAGLIAFGLGALVGGLIPASQTEKDLARTAKDKAQPLLDEAQAMAQDAAGNLQPLAESAVAEVKDAATAAGEHVKEEATTAKDTVTDQAKSSAQDVKQDDRNPL